MKPGRRSAAGQAGEDRLCRLQQFRRLGYRHGVPGSIQARHDGVGQRAEHLPSQQPDGRAGGGSPRAVNTVSASSRGARWAEACWVARLRRCSKTGRRSDEQFASRVEENRSKLERYETLCRELGEPPAAVALAWLLHNPVVTAPIIGPRTLEQLESAVRAASIELDPETLIVVDEIFPGPGGEAPKAYAW
jgi:hypothetical protein